MATTVKVTALSGQVKHTVELTKTGAGNATASVDGTNYDLTNVKATHGGLILTCTYHFGFIPINPTCTIQPSAPPANSDITIVAGPLTLNYQLSSTDEQTLVNFLKTNFP
jgi:hypothetical protein